MLSTLTSNISFKLDKDTLSKAIPLGLVILIGYVALANYLLYNFHLVLGLIVLIASTRIDETQRSRRYIIPIIGCFILLFFVKITFAYYLVWILCILALVELLYGKTNLAAFFAFLFISPLFEYFKVAFGFPIRIAITDAVVDVMQLFFNNVTAAGNIIYFGEQPFYIDEACSGLNTLGFAIALTLILVGWQERKVQKNLHFVSYVFILIGATALVVYSNAVRIALLVVFKVPAGTTMHEGYGIVVIITHIVIPLYFILNQIPKFKVLFKQGQTSTVKYRLFWTSILVIGCLFFGIKNIVYKPNLVDTSFVAPPNYKVSTAELGVTKLQSDKALIYVKPPVKPYQLEHSPSICWVGSGYNFTSIEESTIYNQTIYTGLLKNKDDLLYTAWWFDSEFNKTINPFEWRLDGLKNNVEYRLINVTCSSEEDLMIELEKWL